MLCRDKSRLCVEPDSRDKSRHNMVLTPLQISNFFKQGLLFA